MGRPKGWRKTKMEYFSQYGYEISLLDEGYSLRKVRKETGTSINTLRKLRGDLPITSYPHVSRI